VIEQPHLGQVVVYKDDNLYVIDALVKELGTQKHYAVIDKVYGPGGKCVVLEDVLKSDFTEKKR
jgi:hypothetical protein